MYPQGRMSHQFREMKEADYMAVKGPKVARAILEDESDKTKLDLIYVNVSVDDILLKEELDALATKYAGRFKVYYVLNQPPEGWTGGVGFVSKEMIAKYGEDLVQHPTGDIDCWHGSTGEGRQLYGVGSADFHYVVTGSESSGSTLARVSTRKRRFNNK